MHGTKVEKIDPLSVPHNVFSVQKDSGPRLDRGLLKPFCPSVLETLFSIGAQRVKAKHDHRHRAGPKSSAFMTGSVARLLLVCDVA
ncbi:hypothetical protein ElyMa_001672200 [Elysia marginata]|uniref:Uncharacterized protein n=1 Tax=Elysia marginata TaxID=1093978 RepID=A0AAV4JR26_9GAST|nr:hypothetical protein ElyMa_001672200 [Elysia marginata]